MADVSVIIVSWNAMAFLRDCLQSLESTKKDLQLEVIVIDNASTDTSVEMVKTEFPSVDLVVLPSNLGFAGANNIGIEKARGRFIALINSDVIVHEGCFQRLLQFLNSNPGVGLVGPRILNADGSLQRSCRLLPTIWNTFCESIGLDTLMPNVSFFSGREMRHWNQLETSPVEVLSGCFWIARREAVDAIGGLDTCFFFYAEDVDWCKRFHDGSWDVYFVADASATHFGGGSSSNASLLYSIQMVRSNIIYWQKHYGSTGSTAYQFLSIIYHGVRVLARFPAWISRRTDSLKKLNENYVCLRWLLTRKEFRG